MKKAVLLIAVLLVCCFIPSCKSQKEIIDIAADIGSVDRLVIMSMGHAVTITDEGRIAEFLGLLDKMVLTKTGSNRDIGGYQYYVDFYSGDTMLLRIVTYGTGDTLSMGDSFYTVLDPETVEAFIALIEEQYQ